MLAKGKIANFVGGISQQDAPLRLPTQSSDELNTYPVIVDGNKKRPPTEIAAFLPAKLAATAFAHFIVRDATERYCFAISGGALTVTDLLGNAKAVTTPNGTAYLNSTAGVPDNANFSALTIADFTFIVNHGVTCRMSGTTAPTRLPEALINIVQAEYGKAFSIKVNGIECGKFATGKGVGPSTYDPSKDSLSLDTVLIAQELWASMTGNTFIPVNGYNNIGGTGPVAADFPLGGMTVANGWNVQQFQNAIWIQSLTGVDFTVEVDDGYNGNNAKVIKGSTARFTDLPSFGPDGFVATIVGDNSNPNKVYYLQFAAGTGTGGATAPQGVWKEVMKPGLSVGFDASTMPHVLIRNADGTFTFKEATWNPRECGDDTTAPAPSFIGLALTAIEFFQNRMILFANSNVVASGSGDFFGFFRQTVVTVLDDDPFDVNAASQQVSIMRAGAAYQQSLILFTDLNQFSLSGNSLLTSTTVNLGLMTQYENLSASVRPVATPRRVIFAVDRNEYVGLREWYYDIFYHLGQADTTTDHVPTLIPTGIFKMTNSTIEDLLVLASAGDTSSLWAYKYHWQGQDKVQAAWTKWTFPGAVILNVEFINSTLYILMNRGNQTTLETMRMYPMLTDAGNPIVYLDRRIGSEKLAAPSYDARADATTYMLPYSSASPNFKAVTRANSAMGAYYDALATTNGQTVTLPGDTRDWLLYFGETYPTTYTFSPIYVRDNDAAGPNGPMQEGRLQLLKLDIAYQTSGYFRVEVTPPGRPTNSYEFNGWNIGDNFADLDSLTLTSGIFTVPVLSRSDYVKIELIADSFLPAQWVRAEWKGNFVPKTRK